MDRDSRTDSRTDGSADNGSVQAKFAAKFDAKFAAKFDAKFAARADAGRDANLSGRIGNRTVCFLAGWLLARFGRTPKPAPRLRLMERIPLGPRQTLSLVEAEGRRVLVATSPEGAPAFYEIDRAFERAAAARPARVSQRVSQRVSW